MKRDLSIDYAKGIAILFVYLGHSIIYHPIDLTRMYHWCYILDRTITSFNMPMFFILSGILFGYNKKGSKEIIKAKTKRLLVPYIVTMSLVVLAKYFISSDVSLHSYVGWSAVKSIIFYGGDRWFVYVLLWIFVFSIPIREIVKTQYVVIPIAVSITVSMTQIMPEVFLMQKVFYYLPFFLMGMYCSGYYCFLKKLLIKYFYIFLFLFFLLNCYMILYMQSAFFLKNYILPFSGTALFIGVSAFFEMLFLKGNNRYLPFLNFIGFCGKYSLQFYLFSFAYPIIRFVVVRFTDNPIFIVAFVFFFQLLFITLFVSVTKKISCLKIPFGY